jgi:hypothetical protein
MITQQVNFTKTIIFSVIHSLPQPAIYSCPELSWSPPPNWLPHPYCSPVPLIAWVGWRPQTDVRGRAPTAQARAHMLNIGQSPVVILTWHR